MKKLIYIVIFSLVTAMTVSSCTEQEVKPKEGGTGGTFPDPKG